MDKSAQCNLERKESLYAHYRLLTHVTERLLKRLKQTIRNTLDRHCGLRTDTAQTLRVTALLNIVIF